MFVDEVLVLPVPVAVAQDRLVALHDDGGVQDAATCAFREGHALLLDAGFTGWIDQVAVHSVPAYLRGGSTIVPLRWVVTGESGEMFPAVDANLELDRAPGGCSRLTFRGSYRSPSAQLGFVLDQPRLQRAARASVRGLLDRVAGVVTQRAPIGTTASRGPDRAPRRATDRRRLLADPPLAVGPAPSG